MTVASTTDSIYTSVLNYSDTTTDTIEDDDLGRDAFMKMLIAQMQYQDPLNPMESADFSSQLAEFSSLEQMYNMNETLTGIQESIEEDTDNANKNVLDYIGKTVTTDSTSVKLTNNGADTSYFEVAEDAEAYATIYDESGTEVTTLYLGDVDAGTNGFTWDGVNSDNEKMDNGTYYIDVAAYDSEGNPVDVEMTGTGVVAGVVYDDNSPYLVLEDGRQIRPSSIIQVYDTEEAGSESEETTEDDTVAETEDTVESDETETEEDDETESDA